MALALFDLDNTLLNGDSDHGWGMYLAEIGALNAAEQQQKQDYFYQQYLSGELDIVEFCEYQFEILAKTPLATLQDWHAGFMCDVIEPMIITGKSYLLKPHIDAGDEVIIITATNDFVTRPIARRLGVNTLLATTAEFKDGKYTGKIDGTPCFQDGKVARLQQWLSQQGLATDGEIFKGSTFYSDSMNDLPLLELVETPIAVTPDDKLRKHAQELHWEIID